MNNEYAGGRLRVLDDGTLRISNIQKADEGQYTCTAYSSVGQVTADTQMTVKG